jgi:hypothetical protein
MSSIDMTIDDMMDVSRVNGFLSIYLEMMDKIDGIDHLAYPPHSLFNKEYKSYRMDQPIRLTGDPRYIKEEISWMMFATRSIYATLSGKGKRFYTRQQTAWIKSSFRYYMAEIIAIYYNGYNKYDPYLSDLCKEIIDKYVSKKIRSHKKKMAPKHVQVQVPVQLQKKSPVPVQMHSVQEDDMVLI